MRKYFNRIQVETTYLSKNEPRFIFLNYSNLINNAYQEKLLKTNVYPVFIGFARFRNCPTSLSEHQRSSFVSPFWLKFNRSLLFLGKIYLYLAWLDSLLTIFKCQLTHIRIGAPRVQPLLAVLMLHSLPTAKMLYIHFA